MCVIVGNFVLCVAHTVNVLIYSHFAKSFSQVALNKLMMHIVIGKHENFYN